MARDVLGINLGDTAVQQQQYNSSSTTAAVQQQQYNSSSTTAAVQQQQTVSAVAPVVRIMLTWRGLLR
jgi:hypothetical protein